jgi:hypothetical protein
MCYLRNMYMTGFSLSTNQVDGWAESIFSKEVNPLNLAISTRSASRGQNEHSSLQAAQMAVSSSALEMVGLYSRQSRTLQRLPSQERVTSSEQGAT